MSCKVCGTQVANKHAQPSGVPALNSSGGGDGPKHCPECGGWLRTASDGGCTQCEAKRISETEAWKRTNRIRGALTPEAIQAMSTDQATERLEEVFCYARVGKWGGFQDGDSERIIGLYRKADLSRINPDTVLGGYESVLQGGTADAGREITRSIINNHAAPMPVVNRAAEEMAFGSGFRKKDATALSNHPLLGVQGQEMMARSPDRKVREAIATSRLTPDSILVHQARYDPDERVALAALRNPGSHLYYEIEVNRDAGITDLETLRMIRRQSRDWRTRPRCGLCGAWTSTEGICNNKKRCNGAGLQMAEPEERRTLRLPFASEEDLPSSLIRRVLTHYNGRKQLEAVQNSWNNTRMEKKGFPDEWREALPAAISQLATTGKWETPTGDKLVWDHQTGVYTLYDMPVQANSAGDAIKTYFAFLHSGSGGWRYSPGYDAVVETDVPEPVVPDIEGNKTIGGVNRPGDIPDLPKRWRSSANTRKTAAFDRNGETLIVHKPDSTHYAYLREEDAFTVDGKSLKDALSALEGFTVPTSYVYKNAWLVPPNNTANIDIDAPQGAWVASDGYRLMMVAHEGDSDVPYIANTNPAIAPLVADGPVQVGSCTGIAFTGKGGHLIECKSTEEEAWSDSLTRVAQGNTSEWHGASLEPGVVKSISDLVGRSDNPNGKLVLVDEDLYLASLSDTIQANEVERIRVGRLVGGSGGEVKEKGTKEKVLAGVDMQKLSKTLDTKVPHKGTWELRIDPFGLGETPLHLKHSSQKALCLFMPKRIDAIWRRSD